MNEIKTVEEAINYLLEERGTNVKEIQAKWEVWDTDWNSTCIDDKDLIRYANEQKKDVEANE